MPVTSTVDVHAAARTPWDVIVLGAGPAGALVSYELARRQQRVLLVERKEYPRYKVCGACVNASALAQLAASGLGSAIEQLPGVPLQRVVLGSRWGRCTLPIAPGRALARQDFDEALVSAAITAGADFRAGTQGQLVASSAPEGARQVAVQQAGQAAVLTARVVIVATGLGSVARVLGHETHDLVADDSRLGLGGMVAGSSRSFAAESIWMAVGRHGYVGAVQLADGHLNVAAALDRWWLREQASPHAALQDVLRECGFPELTPVAPPVWQGTPALTRAAQQSASWRVLLIGDAAGYIEPFTGEGIAWALESARAAAALVAPGVAAWSARYQQEWQQWQRSALRHRQQRCRRLTSWLRRPWAVCGGTLSARCFPRLAGLIAQQLTRPSTECVAWS